MRARVYPLSHMEAATPLLVLLALFFFIAVPILSIIAFARVRKLEDASGIVRQILGRLYTLEQRLDQIERTMTPAGRPAAAPAPPPAALPKPEPPRPVPATPIAPAPPASMPPRPAPPSLSAPLSRPAAKPISQEESANFEALVAGRWMHYVGIIALFFAVTFFLKYAFENNWVGPRGRVGIGLLVGSALFPWSQRLLEKGYRYFSEGIAGLGAAVLYLSLWAGCQYYHLFSQSAGFALMIVVTAATALVAVGRNSERIAVLSLIGGVITPWLVSTGENHETVLFTYLIVLGAGMLGLARARDWKTLPPIQFAATLVYFWGWYNEFYAEDALVKTIFFATIFFLLFAALPVVRSRREGELSVLEASIVLVNSFAYLIALRAMLWPERRWVLTVFVLALAAAHLFAERALPAKETAGARLGRVLYAGLALTFVTLAIPIRLDGKWITIGWAVQGAVLVWSGIRIRVAELRAAGFLLFVIAAGRLVFIPIPAGQLFFNARFLTFAIVVASFVAAYLFARDSDIKLEQAEMFVFQALAIGANVLALAALSLEIWDAFGRMPSLGIDTGLAQELALSSLWLVYALGLIVAGMRKKSAAVRWQALALLGVVIAKVFLFDLSFLQRFYRIISFLLLGLVLMLISFFYQRRLAAMRESEKGS